MVDLVRDQRLRQRNDVNMESSAAQIKVTMHASERRVVGVVALIAICRMFGLFALLPVLAIYAGEMRSASPLLVGIAVGGYGLTQALLQVPFGAISDRIGRLPVIVFGLLVFAAGSAIAAESTSIHGVIGGRLLQGAGAISATLSALLADGTREEIRTRSMAILGIGIGSSFIAALIVGPLLAAAFGVRALFWIAAALAAVAALLLLMLPRGIERPAAAADRSVRIALRADLLQLDGYIFLLHMVLTAIFVALPFMLRNALTMPLGAHWQIYVSAMFLSLVGTIPLILADERKGKSGTVSAAILLLAVGLVTLAAFGPTPASVVVGLAIFFAGFNFLEAGLPARLSVRAAGAVRGAALGVYSSAQFLGAFAGGLVGGRFLASGNPGTVFLVCAAACGAWLVLHRIFPEAGEKQSKQP